MRTVWLASYPKSGNTWFRIFLANLMFPEQAPVQPDRLPLSNLIASARAPFEEILGVPSTLLQQHEIAFLRPGVDRMVARDWAGPLCVRKVHDAYTWLSDGRPLLGRGPDYAALYLLREPWDVAVSAASHWGLGVDDAAARMMRPHSILGQGDDDQVPQRLLSWSGHVLSWLHAPLNLHLLRYEDMLERPLSSFRRAVRFLGLQHSDAAIETALDACRFERLQDFEQSRGFRETSRHAERFFRGGRRGEGKKLLDSTRLTALQQEYQHVEQAVSRWKARA